MALSVQKDKQGPLWPLGLSTVASAGTTVNIMSLVDPNLVNAPGKPTPGTVGADEYTVRCQQIIFQACKSVGPWVDNVGPVYINVAPQGSGTGTGADSGSIVHVLQSGETFFLSSAPLNRNVFSPYKFHIDADNSGDGVLVTLVIQ